MAKTREKEGKVAHESVEKRDAMDIVNDLSLDEFSHLYVMEGDSWRTWTHPKDSSKCTVSIESAATLGKMKNEFDSCFKLIELTSSADYKKSKDGWKPKSKRKEMMLLDMKYFLVKNDDNEVEAFCAFMPTYEDEIAVVYLYEIHLSPNLQGTGLGKVLMGYVNAIASKIPEARKIMLTVFLCNERAIKFYRSIGFEKDAFSPRPKRLRNGTLVEADYLIMSKSIERANSNEEAGE